MAYLRPTIWFSERPNLSVTKIRHAILTQSQIVPSDYLDKVETQWTLFDDEMRPFVTGVGDQINDLGSKSIRKNTATIKYGEEIANWADSIEEWPTLTDWGGPSLDWAAPVYNFLEKYDNFDVQKATLPHQWLLKDAIQKYNDKLLEYFQIPDVDPPEDYRVALKASLDAVEALLAQGPNKDDGIDYRTISGSPSPSLRRMSYINLDIQSSFHVPLPSSVKFVQFSNTNGTASWDESDRIKLEGKTAAEALSAGLSGKVVLIGDSTQTFEYFGVRSPGPFVFHNKNRMVQIIEEAGIYQVSDMLLQVLDQTTTAAPSGRTIYTSSSAIVPQNGDLIIIDGAGNINLPVTPADGFRFTLDDRKFRRLEENRNAVVPAVGDAIGLGQTSATIDHLSPLTWVSADKGSFSNWIYEAASKNWVVLLTREIAGTSITQSTLRPTITTGNTDISAVPYDRFFLGGTGNILINGLTSQREFIDISWAPNSTWIMKVICPVGFTIMGAFEDLEINTALTSVTHLQIALGSSNNFEVTG